MLTVNYTYYENKPLFEKIKAYYTQFNLPFAKFVICDDASSKQPLSAEDMPQGWELYRVNEDIGFNNEGARNMLMQETTTEWNLLLDAEFVVHEQILQTLNRRLKRLDKNKAWFTQNGPNQRIAANSFAVTKDTFWRYGGYDQRCPGLYGNDVTFCDKFGSERNPGMPGHRPIAELYTYQIAGAGSGMTKEEKYRVNTELTRKLNAGRLSRQLREELIPATDVKVPFTWEKLL